MASPGSRSSRPSGKELVLEPTFSERSPGARRHSESPRAQHTSDGHVEPSTGNAFAATAASRSTLGHWYAVRASNGRPDSVTSLFRQSREDDGRRPSPTIDQFAGQNHNLEHSFWPQTLAPNNTQIYEGTNQIQRVVMVRQILKG
jgi:hypothetical protein